MIGVVKGAAQPEVALSGHVILAELGLHDQRMKNPLVLAVCCK